MIELHVYTPPPSRCGYLPDRDWQLTHALVDEISPQEYQQLIHARWRRFGRALFRPTCPTCRLCQSIRVPVRTFQPNRSQRRAWKANAGVVRLTIGRPTVGRDKLDLYDRYHHFQHRHRDWPEHHPETARGYAGLFVDNPLPSEEWCYHLDGRLVGVGYVDPLPEGLSAVYFFYDPEHRQRSLGTFNILSLIRSAADRGLPYVYLGFYVPGCRSVAYKALFRPNELQDEKGVWRPFR